MTAAKKMNPVAVVEQDAPSRRRFSEITLKWRNNWKKNWKRGQCRLKGCGNKSYAPRGIWCKEHKKELAREINAATSLAYYHRIGKAKRQKTTGAAR